MLDLAHGLRREYARRVFVLEGRTQQPLLISCVVVEVYSAETVTPAAASTGLVTASRGEGVAVVILIPVVKTQPAAQRTIELSARRKDIS